MRHLVPGIGLVCVTALLQVTLVTSAIGEGRRGRNFAPSPRGARRTVPIDDSDSNDILRGDVGDLQCGKLIADVQWAEATVSARLPPDPSGTWVSQRCETRPGPEFLMRKYTIHRNATFRLVQHFYADHQCTTPVFSVTATGSLQMAGPSWTVPGATESDYVLGGVRVTAHSRDMAEALAVRANRTCPGIVSSAGWRVGRWYTVYSYVEESTRTTPSGATIAGGMSPINSTRPRRGIGSRDVFDAGAAVVSDVLTEGRSVIEGAADGVRVLEDVDCLQALGLTFDELQLLRVEVRKSDRQIGRRQRQLTKRRRTELLLGEVHVDVESGRHFRPTSYQQPLLRTDQLDSCALCRALNKATDSTPPSKRGGATQRPTRIRGEWVSTRCETRPNSLFLTRRLQFEEVDDDHATWRGFYHFFGDPRCSRQPLFTLRMRGRYSLISNDSSAYLAPSVDGSTDAELQLERVQLTPHTAGMAGNLNGHTGRTCGRPGSWRPAVPQELADSGGCSGLGLVVPSVQREVVRVETDEYGGVWLSLGQTSHSLSDPDTPSGFRLPTSFQWPLLRCRTTVEHDDVDWGDDDDTDNDLGQLDNDLHAMPPIGGAVYSSRLDAEAPPHRHSGGDVTAASLVFTAGALLCSWWKFHAF